MVVAFYHWTLNHYDKRDFVVCRLLQSLTLWLNASIKVVPMKWTSAFLWHSPGSNFIISVQATILIVNFENHRLLPQLPWTIELMRFLPATQIVHQGIWLINWTMFSSHLLAINIVILRHSCYQYTYLMVNFLCNVLKEMYIAHELYTWSSNQILLSEVHKKHLYENSPTFRKKYSGIMCPVIAW